MTGTRGTTGYWNVRCHDCGRGRKVLSHKSTTTWATGHKIATGHRQVRVTKDKVYVFGRGLW